MLLSYVANGADPLQESDKCTLVDISALVGNFEMVGYWIEEISGWHRMTNEEDKKAIRSAYKLAIKRKHTDIALILGDQYKRLSANL
jgi:hypothetical protein